MATVKNPLSEESPIILKESGEPKQGLQSEVDVNQFLASRAGQEVVADVAKKVEEKEKQEEALAQYYIEEQQKEAAASEAAAEEEEENEAREAMQIEQAQIAEKRVDIPKSAVDANIVAPGALDSLEEINKKISSAKQKLTQTKKKYDNYDKQVKETDSFIDTLEQKNKTPIQKNKALQAEIKSLEKSAEKDRKKIQKLVENDQDEQALQKQTDLNATYVRIGTLKDMQGVLKGEKQMYNKDGKQVQSFKDADFIVPANQKLSKDGDKYFLTQLNEKGEASAEKREIKPAEFAEMSNIRNVLKSNRKLELNDINTRVADLQNQKAEIEKTAPKASEGQQPAAGAIPENKDASTPKKGKGNQKAAKPKDNKEEDNIDKSQPAEIQIMQMLLKIMWDIQTWAYERYLEDKVNAASAKVKGAINRVADPIINKIKSIYDKVTDLAIDKIKALFKKSDNKNQAEPSKTETSTEISKKEEAPEQSKDTPALAATSNASTQSSLADSKITLSAAPTTKSLSNQQMIMGAEDVKNYDERVAIINEKQDKNQGIVNAENVVEAEKEKNASGSP